MIDTSDTICALSTPPGRSGIALVRMSGAEALSILKQIFRNRSGAEIAPDRRAVLGALIDPRNRTEIDEAVATCFHAPHSYTGEDMCEISLHGSPVLISALIECLCCLGARIAEPGEFTLRAFLHGRMDLTQAEAVRDIIDSSTLYQAQVAARQRAGMIGRELLPLKTSLIDVIVNLESAVEFAEDNLPVDSREAVTAKLETIREKLLAWIDSGRRGRIIRDGFSLAIIGGPNVGKSSLFNALLAQKRSIVTDIPGTTRDLVSESMNLDGIPVRLQDTAGIRSSENLVEQLGIDRSRQAIADSDAVLLVGDISRSISAEDCDLRELVSGLNCIVVYNKCDLACRWTQRDREKFSSGLPRVEVSAKTRDGMEILRGKILEQIMGPGGTQQEGMMITGIRHCAILDAAQADIQRGILALRNGLSEEFALSDLHSTLRRLGEITGETCVDDLLTEIFSRFCIGK